MDTKGKNKRIAYVLRKFPVLSETFILNEILELESQGIDVHIFSVEKPNDPRFHKNLHKLKAHVTYIPDILKPKALLKEGNLALAHFDKRFRKTLTYSLKQWSPTLLLRFFQSCYLANAAKKRGIGHFHAHFATRATSVAFLSSMLSGIPYSFTAHAVDIFKKTLSKDALKRKIEHAKFIVAVSDYNKSYLSQLSHPSSGKILRIYNGIDLSLFQPAPAPPSKPFTFLCVARFVEKKGHSILLDACEILKNHKADFRLSLVGKGPLQKEIERQIVKKGLKDFVEMTGPLNHDEVLNRFHRSHAYILPCTMGSDGNKDGLPVAIVEALACGIPVITTPMTGNPEAVKDKHNGLMVPFESPNETAKAMIALIEDQALYTSLRSNARKSVEELFDSKKTTRALAKQLIEEDL